MLFAVVKGTFSTPFSTGETEISVTKNLNSFFLLEPKMKWKMRKDRYSQIYVRERSTDGYTPQYKYYCHPGGCSSNPRSCSTSWHTKTQLAVAAAGFWRPITSTLWFENSREKSCARRCLGTADGIKANGMIGQRGDKTNGANRKSRFKSNCFVEGSDASTLPAHTHFRTRGHVVAASYIQRLTEWTLNALHGPCNTRRADHTHKFQYPVSALSLRKGFWPFSWTNLSYEGNEKMDSQEETEIWWSVRKETQSWRGLGGKGKDGGAPWMELKAGGRSRMEGQIRRMARSETHRWRTTVCLYGASSYRQSQWSTHTHTNVREIHTEVSSCGVTVALRWGKSAIMAWPNVFTIRSGNTKVLRVCAVRPVCVLLVFEVAFHDPSVTVFLRGSILLLSRFFGFCRFFTTPFG